jgi:hypothetical protein
MPTKFGIQDLTFAAADMWNAFARAQNEQARELVQGGLTPTQVAMAAYTAAQAIVLKLGALLEPVINPEAKEGIDLVVKSMADVGEIDTQTINAKVTA